MLSLLASLGLLVARPCFHHGAHLARASVVLAADPASATLAFREEGAAERDVPDVTLTRSRDGSTGTATFKFERASVMGMDDVWDNGLITGLWLRDQEGNLVTEDVSVTFARGKPSGMVAILVLKSSGEVRWPAAPRTRQL